MTDPVNAIAGFLNIDPYLLTGMHDHCNVIAAGGNGNEGPFSLQVLFSDGGRLPAGFEFACDGLSIDFGNAADAERYDA